MHIGVKKAHDEEKGSIDYSAEQTEETKTIIKFKENTFVKNTKNPPLASS